jgi:fumarate reductase iron-sulfur subunit
MEFAMSEKRTVTITVTRQEPGEAPHNVVFEVPYDERMSVLDALDWIKDHKDPSLTFRWSCRSAVCGSCGIIVNGRPVLGCETFVAGYGASGISVEPLAGAEVLRDLVVDVEPFLAKLRSLSPWLTPPPLPESLELSEGVNVEPMNSQQAAQVEAYRGLAECIDCMICQSACPVIQTAPAFVGPAAVATARRWDLDSRDGGSDERFEAMAGHEFGVWPCTQELKCTRACPKGVDPAQAILAVQRLALA